MNTIATSKTITSSEFLINFIVPELASSSSSQGAHEGTGHGSEIGTSKVSPQQP